MSKAIDNALSQWMPLAECIKSMYVRPGTLPAELLLREAEKKLKAARIEHEAAKTMSDVGCRKSDVKAKRKKTTTGAVGA